MAGLRIGSFIETSAGGERVRAYLPPPLPPNPPLRLDGLSPLIERANRSLGRLDGASSILPGVPVFQQMYARKEALLSSQIEGTQSSLSDLLLFDVSELPSALSEDAQEVRQHVVAMQYGLDRIRRDGFPLSLRLIRDIHGKLMAIGRGANRMPGEFRTSQNWIQGTRPGNAVYVPPPPDQLMHLLGEFESFLHAPTPNLPVLVKTGLIHVQFETIHPFLDGNGRLGRLLITFMLCAEGFLREPLLYLSLYLKQNRATYYELLQRVRFQGEWEAWTEFFLHGIDETAEQAANTATRLLTLFREDRARVEQLRRAASSALRVHQLLQEHPLTTIPWAADRLGLSQPTVTKALEHLLRLDIVREITGRLRNRVFSYHRHLNILAEGTEPLPR
jgi:Fic family protein